MSVLIVDSCSERLTAMKINCEDQNLLHHCPFNFTALPTSGRRYFILILLDMPPRKVDKPIPALTDFHFILFTCM